MSDAAYADVAPTPDYEPITSWCKRSGMSPAGVYLKLQSGELIAIKLGARTLVDVKHGLNWLASQPRWKPSAPVQKSPRHKRASESAAAT